jgi:uncharacterized protein YqgC (DUF456 family)
MNEIRLNLVTVIIFAIVGVVLLFVGLILFLEGFDKTFSTLLVVSGIGLMLAAFGLAAESGFVERKGTLASTPS